MTGDPSAEVLTRNPEWDKREEEVRVGESVMSSGFCWDADNKC